MRIAVGAQTCAVRWETFLDAGPRDLVFCAAL
jgi:hypothetical protein